MATDEIKKLHHHKYFLQLDGSQAYWSIPIDEESKRLLAFQTHEGVFAWDRLTMGARPSSAVQQTAYIEILDRYLDPDIYKVTVQYTVKISEEERCQTAIEYEQMLC